MEQMEQMEKIDRYIKKNISKRVYVGMIAKIYDIDYVTLTEQFKEYKGEDIEKYIRNLEIEKILGLLRINRSTETILKISGIKELEDLNKLFLEYKKITFEEYVKKIKQQNNKKHEKRFLKIKQHIEKNYCKYNYKIEDISKSIKISPTLVHSIWKKFETEKIMNYVYRLKIEKAKKLLKKGYTSNQVAKEIGVKNTKGYPYFSRFFKNMSGESVTDYLSNYNLDKEVEKYR